MLEAVKLLKESIVSCDENIEAFQKNIAFAEQSVADFKLRLRETIEDKQDYEAALELIEADWVVGVDFASSEELSKLKTEHLIEKQVIVAGSGATGIVNKIEG